MHSASTALNWYGYLLQHACNGELQQLPQNSQYAQHTHTHTHSRYYYIGADIEGDKKTTEKQAMNYKGTKLNEKNARQNRRDGEINKNTKTKERNEDNKEHISKWKLIK